MSEGAADTGKLRVVAIDGVLGAGKTTVARALADRLGLEYLDTGAMYRCIGLAATQQQLNIDAAVDPSIDGGAARAAVIGIAERVRIELLGVGASRTQLVLLDGDDVTAEIRTADAARVASKVATIAEVRSELVRRQRDWAHDRGGGVLEGRDIATVVFPDAALQVFLTADVAERARRRSAEDPTKPYDDVLADLEWRDANDKNRTVDPLRVAERAVVVDTTGVDIDTVVDRIAAQVPWGPDVAETIAATGSSGLLTAQNPPAATSNPAPALLPATATAPTPTPTIEPTRNQLRVFRAARKVFVPAVRVMFGARYVGLENIPRSGAFVLAPTHRSNLDFAFLPCLTTRRLRFLGKDTIWKYKALGPLFDSFGGIPVHRGSTDRESFRICAAVLEHGDGLVVFPEGSRKSGPTIEDLFDGATYLAGRHSVPIIPVGIAGTEAAMPKGAKFPRRVPVSVIVGTPIPPPAAGRKVTREATVALRATLQQLFDEASATLPND